MNVTEKKFPDQYYVDPYGVDRYVVQEKNLFEWKTPSKVQKDWKRSEFVQFVLFITLLSLILLLLGDPLLFLVFVSGAVLLIIHLRSKPTYLNCKVTTLGIKIEDQYAYWPQLTQFWFEVRGKTHFLFYRDMANPTRYRKLIITESDEDELKKLIGTYLLYKKPQETRYQKMIQTLLEKTPLAEEIF